MYRSVAALLLLSIVGCQTSSMRHPDEVSNYDGHMIGELSQLAGEWEMEDNDGNKAVAAVFAVTSGGSAVREIMFPGQPHEMTNLYHMDGANLVCTHYCAAGNQPRMIAAEGVETDDSTVFHFQFDSVSNLRESHDHYMGDMTLTIQNDGDVSQVWRSIGRDGQMTEPVTFKLKRKQ